MVCEDIADAYLVQMIRKADVSAGRILVADAEGQLAGYASFLSKVCSEDLDDGDLDYAMIDDLVVRDAYRGRGISSKLIQAAEQFAADCGAPWLRMSALAGNRAARNHYASRGFRELYIDFEKDLQQKPA